MPGPALLMLSGWTLFGIVGGERRGGGQASSGSRTRWLITWDTPSPRIETP